MGRHGPKIAQAQTKGENTVSKASKAKRAAEQAAQAQTATLPIAPTAEEAQYDAHVDALAQAQAQAAESVQVAAAAVQGATADALAQAAQGGTLTDKATADGRDLLRKAAQANRKADGGECRLFITACKGSKRAMVCALYALAKAAQGGSGYSALLLLACGEQYKNGKLDGDEYAVIKSESKSNGAMPGYWRYAAKGTWKGTITPSMMQAAKAFADTREGQEAIAKAQA